MVMSAITMIMTMTMTTVMQMKMMMMVLREGTGKPQVAEVL